MQTIIHRMDQQQAPATSHGELCSSCSSINHNGKIRKRMYICVYMCVCVCSVTSDTL